MRTAASSRSFGLLVAFLCLVFAALSYWARGHAYVYWGTVGALFLVISILMPRVLAPLKRLWLGLGHLLHVVVSPVVVGLTYLAAIIPVGILTQIAGKDLLGLRRDASVPSYWVKRPLGQPAPESLRDQF
jgi:hypothetical protein